MVRLKLIPKFGEMDKETIFQSHNGSIKTFWGSVNVDLENLFQSHNGSIKTESIGGDAIFRN